MSDSYKDLPEVGGQRIYWTLVIMGSEKGNIQNTKALYQGLQVEPSDTLRITTETWICSLIPLQMTNPEVQHNQVTENLSKRDSLHIFASTQPTILFCQDWGVKRENCPKRKIRDYLFFMTIVIKKFLL